MTKREKEKWLKALDETEKKWRKAKLKNGEWNYKRMDCPLCKCKRELKTNCSKCIAVLALPTMCGCYCDLADERRSRRPVFDAIRKMRKWLKK